MEKYEDAKETSRSIDPSWVQIVGPSMLKGMNETEYQIIVSNESKEPGPYSLCVV